MDKPKILAKGSLSHEQLSVKTRIGCDGLEVQLLGELIADRESGNYLRPKEIFDLDEFVSYPIDVVHAPLVPGKGDVVLEVLCDDKDLPLLNGIFYIANYFGKVRHKVVTIVLHSEEYYEKLSDMGDAWSRILLVLDRMLTQYPYTEVAIENVSPLRGIGKGKELHLSNNFAFDNVVMVEELRKVLETDRIGTCLDTCHAMLANKYITALYNLVGDVPAPDLSMYKYFERNTPYLKLVHLCDMKGSGYGQGRHGIPFHAGTYKTLSEILDTYRKFKCNCPITLEVEESDYSVCDGYRNTKEQVDIYYKQFYIPTSEQLRWCRENAPDAYKEYNNTVLWALMKNTFFKFHENV